MSKKSTTSKAANTPPSTKRTKVRTEFLFVQTASDAELVALPRRKNAYTLTLRGVQGTVFFSDRPVRAAGHESTKRFVDGWAKGSNSFAENPPNAELVVFRPGRAPSAVTVKLTDPQWTPEAPHRISYTATLVGERAQPIVVGGSAALFIDGGKGHESGSQCITEETWHASYGRKNYTWFSDKASVQNPLEFPFEDGHTVYWS